MKIIDNLFESNIINELKTSADEHFKSRLLFNDQISITESIIDCHGLYLSNSKYFPYSQRCWNIFCLKVKEHVVDFCAEYDVDPFNVIPFSCWSERSNSLSSEYEDHNVMDDLEYAFDPDHQVKKTFIRSVYKLSGSLGVLMQDSSLKRREVELKENSLFIFNGTDYKSTNIYPPKIGECNLIFDWYVNDPFDVPDWILPIT